MQPTSRIASRFRERTPEGLLDAFLGILASAIGQTDELIWHMSDTRKWLPAAANDLNTSLLRATVETQLQQIPEMFKSVRATSRYNRSGNAHTELGYEGVVLTSSSVARIGSLPRKAQFREQRARSAAGNITGQLSLPGIKRAEYDDEYDPDGLIYGILTYRIIKKGDTSHSVAAISFPDRNYKLCLDLLKLPSITAKQRPPVVEEPELKQVIRKPENVDDATNITMIEKILDQTNIAMNEENLS